MAYDNNNFQEFGWEDEINEEGREWQPLPEGDYDFTVAKIERARFNGSERMQPCNMAKVTVTVWGAEDSIDITENLFLCNKMEWKLSQFFLSIGLKKHGEPTRMNWNAAVGKRGKCRVYIDKYKKQDGSEGTSNKIKKFYAYDEQVQTIQPANAPAASPTPAAGGWKAGAF